MKTSETAVAFIRFKIESYDVFQSVASSTGVAADDFFLNLGLAHEISSSPWLKAKIEAENPSGGDFSSIDGLRNLVGKEVIDRFYDTLPPKVQKILYQGYVKVY